jgi:hypothetical protein
VKPQLLTGKDVDVRHMTGQARQFLVAALKCLPPGLPNGVWEGPVGPGVVCAAFGVELWFKALHCAAHPDKPVPAAHDLLKLFKSLPLDVRDEVAAACNYSLDELANALAIDAGVFITWRYAYEHGMGAEGPVKALEADVRLLLELARACESTYGRLTAGGGANSTHAVDNPPR